MTMMSSEAPEISPDMDSFFLWTASEAEQIPKGNPIISMVR